MGFNSRYAGKIHQQIIKGKSGGADNVSIPAMRVRYINIFDEVRKMEDLFQFPLCG